VLADKRALISHYFRAFTSSVQSSDMWPLRRSDRCAYQITLPAICSNASSDLNANTPNSSPESIASASFRILAEQIVGAAQVAPVIGYAIERFAQAMRAPSPRGRAGGLARARRAWRYFDGTFMARRLRYERYATGGRARASTRPAG